MKLIVLTLALLSLAGCASRPVAQPPPFVAADIEAYPATGTATVTGQAFSKTRGGDVKFGAGCTVNLYRATPYLKQFIHLRQNGYAVDHKEEALLAMTRTALSTTADGNGNFEFSNVPAGDYLLETTITWLIPGGGMTGGPVQKFITVKEGEKQKVMLTP